MVLLINVQREWYLSYRADQYHNNKKRFSIRLSLFFLERVPCAQHTHTHGDFDRQITSTLNVFTVNKHGKRLRVIALLFKWHSMKPNEYKEKWKAKAETEIRSIIKSATIKREMCARMHVRSVSSEILPESIVKRLLQFLNDWRAPHTFTC